MRTTTLLASGALLASALLASGCGDEMAGPTAPSASDAQTLDTAQVLSVAQAPTENTDPMPVDNGALIVADADDQTSDPMPVG